MPEPEFSWRPFLAIVVVVILLVGAGIYALSVTVNKPIPAPGNPTVVEGDNVSVNYIGTFGSGINEGKVFDTSLLSVARNNATYPKALSFGFRGVSGYVPLDAHVGPQSYTPFTSLIPGFWQALIGMREGQTKVVTIPPALAYGPANQSLIQTLPLVQELPMLYTYTPAAFGTAYGGIAALPGSTFTDPHWGWTDVILSVNSTAVVLEYAPTLGEVVHPFGWAATVTNLSTPHNSTGAITLTNQLTPSDVGTGTGTNFQTSRVFYLTNVNLQTGTYTLDYNSLTAGATLIFTITLVAIY